MTFKAVICCDALGCYREIELDCSHPGDTEIIADELEADSEWWFDHNNDSHYCPVHAPLTRNEIEDDSDDVSE